MLRRLLTATVIMGLATQAHAADQAMFSTKASKDRTALIAQEFGKDIKGGFYKASDIETYAIDLNGDGTKELITYANTSFWCGSAGCDVGVFQKSGSKWKRIMKVSADDTFGIGDKTSHGYRDVYLKNPKTGAPVRWAFNGKQYVLND